MTRKYITLYECLTKSAKKALSLQQNDGSMLAGHNGPYFDPETPVRNTGHWLITFLKVYEITKEKRFLDAAHKALCYLLSNQARPMGITFWHRKNPEKDFCNGLIGQAWSIEALTCAENYFDAPNILRIAKEVFLLHPFDEKLGLWRRVEVNGSYLSVDETFNHQLWFAASGSLLCQNCKNKEIIKRVHIFMDKIENSLNLYNSGLIVHHLKSKNLIDMLKRMIRAFSNKETKKQIISKAAGIFMDKIDNVLTLHDSGLTNYHLKSKSKAAGYHQFNLYAFALLKKYNPEHQFWQSRKFNLLWKHANTEQYEKELYNSEFGYPYNPPGFEMPFALEIFGEQMAGKQKKQELWLSEQFQRSFNFDSYLMEKGTKDPITHAARIYEATRLPDLNIHL